jgi:hypothetical protein
MIATTKTLGRRFVEEMEKLSAPLLKQSGNGAHEQKAV